MKINNIWPKAALLFAIAVTLSISYKNIKHPGNLIWSDMEGYYTYLPSVFIYGDFVKEAVKDTNYIRPYKDTQKIYSKYTCGVAMLEMPFFLISHVVAGLKGENQDGKSPIYGRGLAFAGLFYLWVGMLFLYKLGIRYYEKKWVILSILSILLGTNLYYYTFFQPAMSHVFSFGIISIFLYLTDTIFIKNKRVNNPLTTWMIYGFVMGLIILIRPTNIILLILPLYIWYKDENEKLQWIRQHLIPLLITAITAFITFLPQFMYWKYISGDWIIYSYGDESFKFWKEPKLFRVLFDAWNGWILYSPIVLLPLYFLIKGRNSNQNYERAYLIIFVLATYIFASWWAWWFGGAFGHRSYVELLTLLVLPLAGLLQQSYKTKAYFITMSIFIIILCYYNLGLTYAYRPPWDGENWTYDSLIYQIKKIFFLAK